MFDQTLLGRPISSPNRTRRLVLRDREIPLGGTYGTGEYRSISCLCRNCGEIWGRLSLAESGISTFAIGECTGCGDPFRIGGTVYKYLEWWTRDFKLETSSDEFLRYEVERKIFWILNN